MEVRYNNNVLETLEFLQELRVLRNGLLKLLIHPLHLGLEIVDQPLKSLQDKRRREDFDPQSLEFVPVSSFLLDPLLPEPQQVLDLPRHGIRRLPERQFVLITKGLFG